MQEQAPVAEQAQEVVRVGFEAALDKRNANWRTEWTDAEVDGARFFYQAALQDTTVFINNAMREMQGGYTWLSANVANTTRATNSVADAEAAEAASAVATLAATDEVAALVAEVEVPVDAAPEAATPVDTMAHQETYEEFVQAEAVADALVADPVVEADSPVVEPVAPL